MSEQQTKIEINLDSTVLSHSGCMLAIKRKVIDGYTEPRPGASLNYGVAVHKYIDTMFQTHGHIPTATKAAMEAFNVPKEDKYKSPHLSDPEHMITTAFNAWEMWVSKDEQFQVLEINGKPCTEMTFSFPYYEDEWIKVNLCGTIDSIGKIKGGCHAIRDFKTTSTWDDKNYFKTYELSRQLRFYVLALKIMSQRFPDSILGRIGATSVGAFIDAIFIKPAANENKYGRSDVYQYSEKDMAQFEITLGRFILQLSHAIRENLYLKEGILNGQCETKWGKCLFWNCCTVDDNIAEILLKRDFVVRKFDPLRYNEVTN